MVMQAIERYRPICGKPVAEGTYNRPRGCC